MPVNASSNVGLLGIAIIVGLMAGGMLAMQPSANGFLGRHLQHPLQASLISFATGTTILLLMNVGWGIFPPRFDVSPSQLPWWVWMGGAIGVTLVTASLILVPKIGSLPWFAAVMTGQTIGALLLDHYGWMGNPRVATSPLRWIGAALLVLGVLAIVQAKRNESRDLLAGPEPVSQPQLEREKSED